MTQPQRYAEAKDKNLCFACLQKMNKGHSIRTCQEKTACGIDDCNSRHHPLLHRSDEQREVSNTTSTDEDNACTVRSNVAVRKTGKKTRGVALGTTVVHLRGVNGEPVKANVLIDEGS
ncbi:MAG: hypothetical protein AAF563_24360, partial [Pseudomonadota bacterium]